MLSSAFFKKKEHWKWSSLPLLPHIQEWESLFLNIKSQAREKKEKWEERFSWRLECKDLGQWSMWGKWGRWAPERQKEGEGGRKTEVEFGMGWGLKTSQRWEEAYEEERFK